MPAGEAEAEADEDLFLPKTFLIKAKGSEDDEAEDEGAGVFSDFNFLVRKSVTQ